MLDFYVVTVARVSARVLHDAVARRINRTSNRHDDVDAVVHPPYPEYRVVPHSVSRDEATICRENRRQKVASSRDTECGTTRYTGRSEDHTSELQSRGQLGCRLRFYREKPTCFTGV